MCHLILPDISKGTTILENMRVTLGLIQNTPLLLDFVHIKNPAWLDNSSKKIQREEVKYMVLLESCSSMLKQKLFKSGRGNSRFKVDFNISKGL